MGVPISVLISFEPVRSIHVFLSVSSVPDWILWIDLLNLTHYITFFGDMLMVDSDSFHQHTCPVQPLLDPLHESTACAGNSISSRLTSFMKAAHPFWSLMLVWTSFSSSYCQNCFLQPHFFLGKRKEIKKRVLSGKPISSCLWNQRMMKNEKLKKSPLMESSTEATLPTVTGYLSELYFSVRNMRLRALVIWRKMEA